MLTAPAMRNGRPVVKTDPMTDKPVEQPIEASTRRIRYVNLRPFFGWWSKEYDAPNPFDRADPPRDAQDVPDTGDRDRRRASTARDLLDQGLR